MRSLLKLPLTLALGLITSPLVLAEDLPKAVQQLEAKGAKIKGSFDAPNGLRGYAAEYQNRGLALYLTADGKHVLVGSLFDEQGQDLSQAPLEKLVYAPMAKEVWAKMEKNRLDRRRQGRCTAYRLPVQRPQLPVLQYVLAAGAALGRVRQGAIAPYHGRHHSRRQPG